MSSSNCCFLTSMQISQEAGKVVCYSHLLKNFPQFIVIHTVKGFGIVNKAEVEVDRCNHPYSLTFITQQYILEIWSVNGSWNKGNVLIFPFDHHALLLGVWAGKQWQWQCSHAKSLQSCPTLGHPVDCRPPGSSVHGVLQARILEWVTISCSRGSFWPRAWTRVSLVSCTGRWVLYN